MNCQQKIERWCYYGMLGMSVLLTACHDKEKGPANETAKSQEESPQERTATGKERDEAPANQDLVRARNALMPLKTGLMSELQRAMAEGGPAAAIEACRLQAPQITAGAAGAGIRVGRTALRLRNPDNQAPAWARPLLQELAQESEPQGKFRSTRLPDGGFGYVESIVTLPPCGQCHGSSISPPVKALLDQHYPHDKAVGFEPGSFRGVFWVEVNE